MMRWIVLAGVALVVGGCGVQSMMVPRVDEQTQAEVDRAWESMLGPVEKVDRETLLGAVEMLQMGFVGVDRAEYRAEKQVGKLLVEMEVHFRREKPSADAFVVRVIDEGGRTVREEWYTREDVEAFEAGARDVYEPVDVGGEQGVRYTKEWEERMRKIEAATQPGRGGER